MSDIEQANSQPSSIVAFAPERRERVKQILKARHTVRVEELKEEFGVSTAPLRRALHELEAEGELRRVHGGAVAIDQRPFEARFEAKAAKHPEA